MIALAEAEHLAVVGADPLEDAVTVQEAVVEDRDLRVFLLVELPVEPDLGHGRCPRLRV